MRALAFVVSNASLGGFYFSLQCQDELEVAKDVDCLLSDTAPGAKGFSTIRWFDDESCRLPRASVIAYALDLEKACR